MKRRPALFLMAIACMTVPAFALDPIPPEGGLSGYVNAGGGYVWIKNPVVAGNRVVDIDNATIDSLAESVDTVGLGMPVIGLEISYTFGTSRSQVVVGNTLEDFLRFEAAAQLAYRKQFGEKDRISAGALLSTPVGEVYADPYVVGVEREVTTRDTRGARFTWDRILGSRVQVDLTYRKVGIDDERSGESQPGLTGSERDLLDRNGPKGEVQVSYTFSGHGGVHAFVPMLAYAKEDLDGAAVAGDAVEFQLTYKYNGRRMAVSSNLRAGTRQADEENPIFGRTMEHDLFGVGVQVFYKKLCGVEGLALLFAAADQITNTNIDFYDAETAIASLGVFYRF